LGEACSTLLKPTDLKLVIGSKKPEELKGDDLKNVMKSLKQSDNATRGVKPLAPPEGKVGEKKEKGPMVSGCGDGDLCSGAGTCATRKDGNSKVCECNAEYSGRICEFAKTDYDT